MKCSAQIRIVVAIAYSKFLKLFNENSVDAKALPRENRELKS
jgi:hypothetical protein